MNRREQTLIMAILGTVLMIATVSLRWHMKVNALAGLDWLAALSVIICAGMWLLHIVSASVHRAYDDHLQAAIDEVNALLDRDQIDYRQATEIMLEHGYRYDGKQWNYVGTTTAPAVNTFRS